MSILKAIIFGAIQGVAEFLPVSSSGHLALISNFFGVRAESALAFGVLLHAGTLLSVCLVYRRDLASLFAGAGSLAAKLLRGGIRREGLSGEEKLFTALCAATLPLIPVKMLGADELVESISGVSFAVGILLVVNGVSLFICDRLPLSGVTVAEGGFLRALGVGIVQACFGIFPGISRSGSTIFGGRMAGYSRVEAVRFSFLMSVPAIAGACVTELPSLFEGGLVREDALSYLAGFMTAAAVGFAAIKLIRFLAANRSFACFAIYCIVTGAAAVIADFLI